MLKKKIKSLQNENDRIIENQMEEAMTASNQEFTTEPQILYSEEKTSFSNEDESKSQHAQTSFQEIDKKLYINVKNETSLAR